MLPRDIGLVIGLTGMNKMDHVLDAGTGSGVAAVFFAGVAGKVTTCERREEFFRIAEESIRETGLSNIEVLNLDVLVEEDTISPEDLKLFTYVDEPQAAWKDITRFFGLPE